MSTAMVSSLRYVRPVWGWVCLAFAFVAFLQTDSVIRPSGLLLPMCISAVIVSTICWQWRIVGDPSDKINLVGHCLLFLAVSAMIARMTAPPDEYVFTLWSAVTKAVSWTVSLVGIFPESLISIMRSPGLAISFLAICLALVLRWPWSIALLGTILLGGIVSAVASDNFTNYTSFVLGLILMAGGFSFLHRRPDFGNLWSRVTDTWSGSRIVIGDFEVVHRLFLRAMQQNGELRESHVLSVIKQTLGRQATDNDIRSIMYRVVRRMVDDGLMEAKYTTNGLVLSPSPRLLAHRVDAWTSAAVLPRAIIVLMLATLWVISPIDLMPDAIPGIGVLDDVVVSSLALGVVLDALGRTRTRRQSAMQELLPETASGSTSMVIAGR